MRAFVFGLPAWDYVSERRQIHFISVSFYYTAEKSPTHLSNSSDTTQKGIVILEEVCYNTKVIRGNRCKSCTSPSP